VDRSGKQDVHLWVHLGFDSPLTIDAVTLNVLERRFPKPQVAGSSPAGDANTSLASLASYARSCASRRTPRTCRLGPGADTRGHEVTGAETRKCTYECTMARGRILPYEPHTSARSTRSLPRLFTRTVGAAPIPTTGRPFSCSRRMNRFGRGISNRSYSQLCPSAARVA
jgi:hypothetical protein